MIKWIKKNWDYILWEVILPYGIIIIVGIIIYAWKTK